MGLEREAAKGKGNKQIPINGNTRQEKLRPPEKITKPKPSNLLTEIFKKKHRVHPQGK